MPRFFYSASNRHGQVFHESMEARDKDHLAQMLDIMGLLLISAHEENEKPLEKQPDAPRLDTQTPPVEPGPAEPEAPLTGLHSRTWTGLALLLAGLTVFSFWFILSHMSSPENKKTHHHRYSDIDLRIIRSLDAMTRGEVEKALGVKGSLNAEGITMYEPMNNVTVEFVYDDRGGKGNAANQVIRTPKVHGVKY